MTIIIILLIPTILWGQVSYDQTLAKLQEHYTKPNAGESIPQFLLDTIKPEQINFWPTMIASCNRELARLAAEEYIHLFEAMPDGSSRLGQKLPAIKKKINLLDKALVALTDYIDNYPAADFHLHFSRAQWDQLASFTQQTTSLKAQLHYYQFIIGKARFAQLRDDLIAIGKNIKTINDPKAIIPLQLWQGKLAIQLIDYNDFYRQLARETIEKLPAPDQLLLTIQLKLKANLSSSELQELAGDLARANRILLTTQIENDQNDSQILKNALLQSHLLQLSIIAANKSLTEDMCWLRSLETIAQARLQLRPIISELLGGKLYRLAVANPQTAKDFLHDFDSFKASMLLARGFDNDDKARKFITAFGNQYRQIHQKGTGHYYVFCYQLAMLNYAQKDFPTASDNLIFVLENTSARWDSYHQYVSAAPGDFADKLAWQLYQNDNKAIDKALAIYHLAQGSFDSKSNSFTAGYSRSNNTSETFYRFGFLLAAHRDYEIAAAAFAQVEQTNSLFPQAQFSRAYSLYQQEISDQIDESRMQKLAKKLLAQIDTLKLPSDQYGQYASFKAHLLNHTRQYSQGIDLLASLSPDQLQQNNTAELTLNLIAAELGPWQIIHAQGQNPRLTNPIKLIDNTLQTNISQQLTDKLQRLYLQLLAIQAVHTDDLQTKKNLTDTAAKYIDKLKSGNSQYLWFQQCQGLYFFAIGQHDQARGIWATIRQNTKARQSDSEIYQWWQARYYSIQSLKAQNPAEAAHIIEVTIKTYLNESNLWLTRLRDE
ncbi:MAG: hypothetical protein JEZ07_16400 [Phycisphaerae bacterium]|nr:hypothetical protein [Phycisphaerae bacterium]